MENSLYNSSSQEKNKLECNKYIRISVTSAISRLYGRIIRNLIEHNYKKCEGLVY